MSAFDDFLAHPHQERCWLLEIDAFPLAAISDGTDASASYADHGYGRLAYGESEGGEEGEEPSEGMLTFSSSGYTSQSGDTPRLTYYDARLDADTISVDRRVYGREGVGGLARTQASVELINADGALDALKEDYALDARPARLLLGEKGWPRDDFGLVFSGVVEPVEIGEGRVRLRFSDGAARLDVALAGNTYAGTGDMEGGDDLAGKPKPRGWGEIYNVAPPLVDGTRLIYQPHDGAVQDIPAVYDRQVALSREADYSSLSDMQTNAPSAGAYRAWLAGGAFRLGAAPDGTITADLEADAAGGYVDTTAAILQRMLLIAGVDSSLRDAASFTQLGTDAPANIGYWAGAEPRLVGAAVEALLEGVGAFGGFSRLNKFTVGVIKAPSGTPADAFDESEIRYLRREPLPPAVEPIVWFTRVAWRHNYTVQTDLADTVTAARRTFAAEADRIASDPDTAVKSRHRLAVEYGPTGNLYADQADAETEAARLKALWGVPRGLYRVGLPARALTRDLGDVVTLTYSRHGFGAGLDVRVLGHTVGPRALVELTVLA